MVSFRTILDLQRVIEIVQRVPVDLPPSFPHVNVWHCDDVFATTKTPTWMDVSLLTELTLFSD